MNKYKPSRFNLWHPEKNVSYLVNTVSKAIVEIKKDEISFVNDILNNSEQNPSGVKFEEYRNIMINEGFLIPAENDELKLLEYRYNQHHFSSNFLNIILLPTMSCNFDCPYCFETDKKTTLNSQRLSILCKFAENYFKHKESVFIGLFGGEPLIEWKKTAVFLEHCLSLQQKYNFNFNTSLTSNGYLLDDDKLELLINRYSCRSFQITIDGNREHHNKTRSLKNGKHTYDQVLDNFIRLINKNKVNKLNIILRINLLNNETTEIEQILAEFSENVKNNFKVYFRPIYQTDNFSTKNNNFENLEDFYNLLIKYGIRREKSYPNGPIYCEGDSGANTFHIMPDLQVWKCIIDLKCNEAKLGHINKKGELILNQNNLEKWSRKNPFTNHECKKCVYLPLCYGGCPLKSLQNKLTCFYEKDFNIVKHLNDNN